MSRMRSLIKDCFPPIILRSIRRMIGKSNHFMGDYATWDEALKKSSGYNSTNILEKVLKSTLKVKLGESVFERDSVLFDKVEYAWPVLSGLMWSAARNNGKLNVLDFGGALGTSYFQNYKFIKDFPEFYWNIVEQEHYVDAGQKYIQNEHLRFYPTIDACLMENSPNVILISGVLHYLPNPLSILRRLINIGASTFILDRTAYSNDLAKSSIKIQTVPPEIYEASYPVQFLIELDFINEFRKKNYVLIESFPSLDQLDKAATWKGHIFKLDRPQKLSIN